MMNIRIKLNIRIPWKKSACERHPWDIHGTSMKKWDRDVSAFFVTPTYPSSSFRCGRKRPSLVSLACASGRLSFAVEERYYWAHFLSAISFHVRTYADASFHITIQARSTNTRFIYVLRPIFHFCLLFMVVWSYVTTSKHLYLIQLQYVEVWELKLYFYPSAGG